MHHGGGLCFRGNLWWLALCSVHKYVSVQEALELQPMSKHGVGYYNASAELQLWARSASVVLERIVHGIHTLYTRVTLTPPS